jgi:hypothetical protein
LGHSHDNYPIALTMLALTESDDRQMFNLLNAEVLDNGSVNNLYQLLGNNGTRIKYFPQNSTSEKMLWYDNKLLGESSFANLISNLYDIEIERRDRDTAYLEFDITTWQYLNDAALQLLVLYPEKENMRLDAVRTIRDFENFILGQGNNKWSNIKLAEAYSRLLSKQKVKVTFLQSNEPTSYLFENASSLFEKTSTSFDFQRTSEDMENAWSSFMRDWRNSIYHNSDRPTNVRGLNDDGNTLNDGCYNFRRSFNNITNEFANYHFYCKTGTPEEEDIDNKIYINSTQKIWLDEGVFVFGITNIDNEQPKGIVGVVYIKHISTASPIIYKDGVEIKRNGVESSTARDFLTDDLYKKIMFYNKNRF